MRVPEPLSTAFGKEFEELVSRFATDEKLLPEPEAIHSTRFLSRSVVPHIRKLSSLFNREEKEQGDSLDPYWKESSNPANLRLAYFLYFMPSNLYRIAAILSELSRLGFRWSSGAKLKGIEFGAGPASGACGIAAGEKFASIGLPKLGNFALIEQDKATLEMGARWAETYFGSVGASDWEIRKFHRKLDLAQGFLPRSAPEFNLWIMSFFLNELSDDPAEIARRLIDAWDAHLEEEGVIILCEPALRLQSRKLLALRKALIEESEKRAPWLKVLLPCLGTQACGALADAEDWCHEEVMWWRPPYFRVIDQMAQLDRKSLPFSYLVLTKSKRALSEILPALNPGARTQRLVSPAHFEGKEQEFFLCGENGKARARYRAQGDADPAAELGRGDILVDSESRGDSNSTRIQKIKKVL